MSGWIVGIRYNDPHHISTRGNTDSCLFTAELGNTSEKPDYFGNGSPELDQRTPSTSTVSFERGTVCLLSQCESVEESYLAFLAF